MTNSGIQVATMNQPGETRVTLRRWAVLIVPNDR